MFKHKVLKQFGGALLKGNAKVARPLSTKKAVHLVLKSTQAIGSKSMLHTYNVNKIDGIIRTHAKLCRIRIYHLVNVGNHLHLVIKPVLGCSAIYAIDCLGAGLCAHHKVYGKEYQRCQKMLHPLGV